MYSLRVGVLKVECAPKKTKGLPFSDFIMRQPLNNLRRSYAYHTISGESLMVLFISFSLQKKCSCPYRETERKHVPAEGRRYHLVLFYLLINTFYGMKKNAHSPKKKKKKGWKVKTRCSGSGRGGAGGSSFAFKSRMPNSESREYRSTPS